MIKTRAAITGVQGYVPDYVLTNEELEKMVDTNDEWITTRTGVKERRILKEENAGSSFMAEKAVNALLEKKKLDPKEIELIIFCTVTPDYPFPASANLLAAAVGATNAWGYDLMAACSGFIYGLTVGAQFIESGKHKKVLVVGSDKMSSIVDYTDRTTCILFGDACGVVLLEPDTTGNGIMDSIMRSDGTGANYLRQKLGGSAYPLTAENISSRDRYIYQDGQTVFKQAVTKMADVAAEIMANNNLSGNDVAWLVPHQANKRIIDATANRMGVGEEKVTLNISRYGNTTSATIPLCLWEWENQFKKGDNLILAAFGGGFTWGSVYLKWAY